MPAADEVLKIQLPSNISRFTFTLETKHSGPMPIKILLPQAASPAVVLACPTPECLTLPVTSYNPEPRPPAKVIIVMPTCCPCKSPVDAKEDPANAELMLLPTLSSTVSSTFAICDGQPTGGNFIKAGTSAVSLIDKTPIEESKMEPESDNGTGIPTQALIAQFQWVGPKILVAAQPDIRPVSHSFPFPSCERPPLTPPDLDFWGLSAPDVQDPMPEIDLNLGLDLPNLVPKIPNPGSLLAALDYYSDYNAVTAANAHPLMSYNAYSLPTDPKQHAFEHQINHAMEAIQMDVECEELNFNHDGSDIEDDDIMVVLPDPVANEDVPDPFSGLAASPMENDFTDIPSHLIMIYALISWLHLQFHLRRSPAMFY
ncbi:hypothetical protein J3A83DRAFT_4412932 [Scleroderma citrinum]